MFKRKPLADILPQDAVAEMQAAYLARIDAAALKATADAAAPDLHAPAVDFLRHLDRLRVKDYSVDQLTQLLGRAKATRDISVIAAELKTVTARVAAREHSVSEYGDAEIPATDMAKFNQAAARRDADPAVDALFGARDRIYLRMPKETSACEKKVAAVLTKLPPPRPGDKPGYTITDWAKGTATDATGKQVFKIGKLLNKHAPELLKDFENRDTGNLLIVISRRADDIARCSTNRGWNSCAGPRAVNSGVMAYGQLESSIRAGVMIAYLIHDRDPDINDPLARVTINIFVPNGRLDHVEGRLSNRVARVAGRCIGTADWPRGDRVYFAGKLHGLHNENFQTTVQTFLDARLNGDAAGSFWLKEGVYRDHGLQNVERNRGRTRRLKRNWDR